MTRDEILETAAVAAMLTGLGAYLYAIAYLMLMP
jgi:alkylhydroperoxidase/carboxymuconolactone decarboxylase family protein YurZ